MKHAFFVLLFVVFNLSTVLTGCRNNLKTPQLAFDKHLPESDIIVIPILDLDTHPLDL